MATGRPCTVCNHPDRAEIDRALVGAGSAVKPISQRFAVSPDSLKRHREGHMPRADLQLGAQAVAAAEGVRGADLLREASALRLRAMGLLDKAEASADIRGANGSLREARECLRLEAQLLGEIGADTATISILVNPQFALVQTVIMTALAGHPAARLAVVRALEGVQ